MLLLRGFELGLHVFEGLALDFEGLLLGLLGLGLVFVVVSLELDWG